LNLRDPPMPVAAMHVAGGAGAPLIEKVRFAADSLVEREGFEPSVPVRRDNVFEVAPVGLVGTASDASETDVIERDKRFESIPLPSLTEPHISRDGLRAALARMIG